jgi:hypothetical protein
VLQARPAKDACFKKVLRELESIVFDSYLEVLPGLSY